MIEHQTFKARPTVVVEEFLYQEEGRENSSDSEEIKVSDKKLKRRDTKTHIEIDDFAKLTD